MSWLKAKDKQLEKGAAAAAQAYGRALSFKEFLGSSYKLPQAILDSHAVNWARRPLPPLDRLCPSDFRIVPWLVAARVEEWYQGLKEGAGKYTLAIESKLCYTPLWLIRPFEQGGAVRPKAFDSNGIPKPELYLSRCSGEPLLLCIVDVDHLIGVEEPPSSVLARLFNYLRITGIGFGVLTSLEGTWICRRKDDELFVSERLAAPAKALGFLLHEIDGVGVLEDGHRTSIGVLQNGEGPSFGPSLQIEKGLGSGSKFDIQPAINILKSLCSRLGVHYAARIVEGVDTGFEIRDLENAQKLRVFCQHSSLHTFKGTYKGQQVVVKIRDLTSPWWYGFQGSLKRMVVEVDTYLMLHKLGKKYFPKLISWGFTSGAMFAYVMTSDEGKSRHERAVDNEPVFAEVPGKVAALENVRTALYELHKRGALHGDVDVSKVVLKQGDGGAWVAKLVGLAESRRVSSDLQGTEAMSKETVKLLEVLRDLAHAPMA